MRLVILVVWRKERRPHTRWKEVVSYCHIFTVSSRSSLALFATIYNFRHLIAKWKVLQYVTYFYFTSVRGLTFWHWCGLQTIWNSFLTSQLASYRLQFSYYAFNAIVSRLEISSLFGFILLFMNSLLFFFFINNLALCKVSFLSWHCYTRAMSPLLSCYPAPNNKSIYVRNFAFELTVQSSQR